jgi:hypothetical protein
VLKVKMVNNIQVSDDAFNKDLEVQSIHSSSTEIEADLDDRKGGVLTEKDDIESYPVVDETEEGQRQKDGAMTRTSTKSSWKDPGPPPDGGREAWTQGSFTSLLFLLSALFLYVTLSCPLTLASRHGSPSSNEHLGLRQLFRRLPNLLCDFSARSSLHNLLDWHRTNFPPLLHRHLHRPSHRRWVFPSRLLDRIDPWRVGLVHGEFVDNVLAAIPCARGVLWTGEWMSFLPGVESVEYVFFEEERVGDWACRDRVSDRRNDLLGHGAAVASKGWVSVDDEKFGVYSVGVLARVQSSDENEGAAQESGGRCGLEKLQGIALHFVCCWDVFCK